MQKVTVLCVGKLKERFYIDAAAEYAKRLSRHCRLEILELPEQRLPEDPTPGEISAALEREAAAVREKLPRGGALVALCVEGKMLSSPELAKRLMDFGLAGQSQLTFLIGGSVGLHPSLKAQADLRLSMSPMTFPHHLARVMRARAGDTVILCDGNAVEYTATITGFGEDEVEFAVEAGYPSAAEPTVEVTLLAGYPKQDKLEQIIRHGVELGCRHVVPFFSRYCVAAPKKEEQKNVRYNRIAYEAAKQCGRGVLPDVALPLPNFGAVCRTFDQYDLVLFCYECGGEPLRRLLAGVPAPADRPLRIALVTGAEGGFAPEEAEAAVAAGAKTVGLGPRILRCETAPLAVLASVMTLTGNLE